MRLRDDPQLLDAAVTQAAASTGIPATQIRKDFWLTEILRACAQQATADGITLVFKGGTSLSKVFGLIERFSEDVDLLVVAPGGDAAVNTAMKSLVGAAEEHIGVRGALDTKTVDTGKFRAVLFAYEGMTGSDSGVLLEVGARGGALPSSRLDVQSIVAPLAQAQLGQTVEEAASFEVSVLSPARTLVEKLVIVHEASTRAIEAGRTNRVIKTVRHYYDIWCLLGNAQVRAEVADIGTGVLAREVCQHSKAIGLPDVAYPKGGFATSSAFLEVSSHEQRKAYGATVSQLLWPLAVLPSFDDCLKRVATYADLL